MHFMIVNFFQEVHTYLPWADDRTLKQPLLCNNLCEKTTQCFVRVHATVTVKMNVSIIEIVGEWVMNPSKNEFALTYIPHRCWCYVCK